MKTRILHTEFWIDEQVMELTPLTKLMFIYFVTNPHIELCPIYRVADRVIAFETGLTLAQIAQAKKTLIEMGKIRVFKDYIYVVNADRYNRFSLGKTTGKGYKREWEKIPEEVKKALSSTQSHTLSEKDNRVSPKSDTTINKKEEIRNNKEGDSKGKQPVETYLDTFNSLFAKKYQATDGRREKLSARLKTYSLDQILTATQNLAASPFHRGKNDRNWSADPDFLIRNDEQVDKWLNSQKPASKPQVQPVGVPQSIEKINNLPKPTAEELARTEEIKKNIRMNVLPRLKA